MISSCGKAGEELNAICGLKALPVTLSVIWAEPGAPEQTADALAAVLRRTADWQGLGDVVVAARGSLAGPLAAAVDAASVV